MRRASRLAIVALILTLLLATRPATSAAFEELDAIFVLQATTYADTLAAEEAVERAGGRVDLIFPNRILLGRITPAAAATLRGQEPVRQIFFDAVDTQVALPRTNVDERAALEFWNELTTGRLADRTAFANHAEHGLLASDAFQAPPAHPNLRRRAGVLDATPVMGGRIVQTVFFVESNGRIDANVENWGGKWKLVKILAIRGLKFWTDNAPPEMDLSFVVKTKKPKRAKTGYEPITRSSRDEGLWISEVMTRQGFPAQRIGRGATYFDQVRAYNARQAKRFKATGGAASEFVVNSIKDQDGSFADGSSAYAYLAGPFTVLTYDNGGWRIGSFPIVQAHENGHLTGRALDEYPGSGCNCTQASPNGTANGNCFTCSDSSCVMKSNSMPICEFTRRQIGWQ
jgi:hypothetical protein